MSILATNARIKVGQEFGKLTVIGAPVRLPTPQRNEVFAVCQCQCGRSGLYKQADLVRARGVKKCPHCIRRTHGAFGTPLYGIWAAMKRRCYNPNSKDYDRYGGRGIRVCDEWHRFEPFREWAESHGYKPGLSIERERVNESYEPSNCSWIPMAKQAANKRNNRRVTLFGETKLLSDWFKDSRVTVSNSKFYQLVNGGVSAEEALAWKPH